MSLAQLYPYLSPSHLRLLEKQQEHAALQALKEASGGLLAQIEELGRKGEIMADGGEAIGSVLRNWPHVFSILNLFDKQSPLPSHNLNDPNTSTSGNESHVHASSTPSNRKPKAGTAEDDQDDQDDRDLPQLVRLAFGGDGRDDEEESSNGVASVGGGDGPGAGPETS